MTHSAHGRLKPATVRKDNHSDRIAPSLVRKDWPGVEQVGALEQFPERVQSDVVSAEAMHSPRIASFAGGAAAGPAVAPNSAWFRLFKRLVDILGAIGLAIVFAPLIVVVALLIRREGGKVIYRHRRVGSNGKMFECLKFRTMVPDADRILHELLAGNEKLKAEWIQNHKLKDDPRVTRIGRFLRRTSLDELPQFWNVLRGDMSLVGPRPIVREELLRYGRNARLYLAVKPGVTGLWQTAGRNDTDYRRRVAMDVYYVRNPNLWLDVLILLRTARLILRGSGAY